MIIPGEYRAGFLSAVPETGVVYIIADAVEVMQALPENRTISGYCILFTSRGQRSCFCGSRD